MTVLATKIQEHGDHVYITSPVQLFEPNQAEIESFVFAADLRSAAPNPKILWLKGQYVEADQANSNADQWTAGELAIKSLTPVLMPITVMHDMRSAVGTIADARLLTPDQHQVPRSRIDTTLAVWEHRFPEVAAECRANAEQGTLMQSMECLAPYYDCSVCGKMIRRTPNWLKEWRAHLGEHVDALATGDRSPARILRNVTFTGVGLIFGTRGARGAMPSAHLEVEALAELHREAHASTCPTRQTRQRRKNTVELEDSKYEALVAAKAEGDSKVADLTAKVEERDRQIEALEKRATEAEAARDDFKKKAEDAEEAGRIAAMRDERLSGLGTGFRAKLDKLEHTASIVKQQAAKLTDEEWESRVKELEESLGVKRDAKLDEKSGEGDGEGDDKGKNGDSTAGTLFDRETVANSGLAGGTTEEVTAGAGGGNGHSPTVERRQSVIGGLVRPRQKDKTAAKA